MLQDPSSPVAAARHAANGTWRRRRILHALAFRFNMLLAGVTVLLLLALPRHPPTLGITVIDLAAGLAAGDPLVRKVLWLSAAAWWLTALLFFQGPRVERSQ